MIFREFDYEFPLQRKFIYFNIFFTFLSLAYLTASLSYNLSAYFFYYPISKLVLLSLLFGFLTGFFFSKLIFSFLKNSRLGYLGVEFFFIFSLFAYSIKDFINFQQKVILLSVSNPFFILIFIFSLSLFVGIKINYFFKVLSGDFIDDKQGFLKGFSFLLLGSALGLLGLVWILLEAQLSFNPLGENIFLRIIALVLLPSLLLIKSSYKPLPLKVQEFRREDQESLVRAGPKSFLFTYINGLDFWIYFFLGFLGLKKFYEIDLFSKLFFFGLTLFSVFLGLLFGRFFKKVNWYIYLKHLQPVFFCLYLFLLYLFYESGSFLFFGAFFMIFPFLFGFSLVLSFRIISIYFKQTKRHLLLSFSLFIIPILLLAILEMINISNLVYFFFLSMALVTSLFSSIVMLLQKDGSFVSRLVPLFSSLVAVGLLLFFNSFYKIPFKADFLTRESDNLEKINDFRYSKRFKIEDLKNNQKISVFKGGSPVFKMSDSLYKNITRSLLTLLAYHPNQEKILFIDSNYKFFPSPFRGLFPEATCLDPVQVELGGKSPIWLSSDAKLLSKDKICQEEPLTFFLNRNKILFKTIVDLPNVLDFRENKFRFSLPYYQFVKRHLVFQGLFVQLFDLKESQSVFLIQTLDNLNQVFSKSLVYLYSNLLLVISSDQMVNLKIEETDYQRLSDYLLSSPSRAEIGFSPLHLFSHLIFTNLNDLRINLPFLVSHSLEQKKIFQENENQEDEIDLAFYTQVNNKILDLVDQENEFDFYHSLDLDIKKNDEALVLLKKIEEAEANDHYIREASFLSELQKKFRFNNELVSYLNQLAKNKEESYYNSALELEHLKKWEEAKQLYQAILIMNKNNFAANYRLGLLCITLQEIDNSFVYMQKAMSLKKEHPEVLCQMGILFYLKDKVEQSILYLNRALQQKGNDPYIYFYLGLAHEKKGRLSGAEYYYNKALSFYSGQGNLDIELKLATIKKKREDFRNRWKLPPRKNEIEEEQGEKIPLPINRSAYEVRLRNTYPKKKINN